jgi:hypothetical protein
VLRTQPANASGFWLFTCVRVSKHPQSLCPDVTRRQRRGCTPVLRRAHGHAADRPVRLAHKGGGADGSHFVWVREGKAGLGGHRRARPVRRCCTRFHAGRSLPRCVSGLACCAGGRDAMTDAARSSSFGLLRSTRASSSRQPTASESRLAMRWMWRDGASSDSGTVSSPTRRGRRGCLHSPSSCPLVCSAPATDGAHRNEANSSGEREPRCGIVAVVVRHDWKAQQLTFLLRLCGRTAREGRHEHSRRGWVGLGTSGYNSLSVRGRPEGTTISTSGV